jgi:AcrR family transcriptional regulator
LPEHGRCGRTAHFDNKEALLDETIRISFLQMVERRLPTGHVTSSADLEPIIVAVCEFLKQLNGKCWQQQRRFGVLVEREIKALLTDILRVWLADMEAQPMRDGASAELTATMASWAIYGAALHWSYQDVRQPEEEFARAVQPLIARIVMLGERYQEVLAVLFNRNWLSETQARAQEGQAFWIAWLFAATYFCPL